MGRVLVVAILCMAGAHAAVAQDSTRTVQRRNLLMHFGFGSGLASLRTSDGHIPNEEKLGPAFEIAAFYTLSNKWSVGLQFARIGELGQQEGEAGRMNGLHFCLARRVYNTPRWYGDASLGLGLFGAALWNNGARLPEESNWGGWMIGFRTGRMWSNVVGTHASLQWWPTGTGRLTQAGSPVLSQTGDEVRLYAQGAVLCLGVFTRF
ncbi:MAG: hypothetical protein JNM31_06145 [Flavobacteriales bacterium]|nr:hypothetical protein [Flavobacteriales bacterium]